MFVLHLNLGLNANQFHTGLNEICLHLKANLRDEYLEGLVREVENAREMLFQAIKKELAKEGIKRESTLLRDRLASFKHFLDSFRFEPDEELKASAKELLRQLKRYGVFNKMDVHSRLTEVQAMLRDLDKPELKALVDKIPGLEARIKNIQSATEALLQRLLDVQKMRDEAKPQKSKLELKRDAAAKLERLLVYLDHMAFKDPDTYGKAYGFVVGLITDLNKTYKHKVRKAKEDIEDNELDDELDNAFDEEEKSATPDELPESDEAKIA